MLIFMGVLTIWYNHTTHKETLPKIQRAYLEGSQ